MKKKIKSFSSYLQIILGALLASFAVASILLPNDAIDYGTAGIAIIISKLTHFNLSLCVFCVFLPFIIMGLAFLGKVFFLKSLVGAIAYTVGLAAFEELRIALNTEHYLAVCFGGALLGLGLSLILKSGGTIDGSEIFANVILNILSKKTGRNYSMTSILIAFNAVVYILAFVLIDHNAALMSLLVYVTATFVTDHFTDHFEAIKQVTIITTNPKEIISQIKEDLNKTCTIIESAGAIAGKNTTLICYINYFELQKMREIISRNKGSFCTVSTIEEILR